MKPVLSFEEEQPFVDALQYCSKCRIPQDRDDIADTVKKYCEYLKKKTPFKFGSPGKDWMISFIRRHSDKSHVRQNC